MTGLNPLAHVICPPASRAQILRVSPRDLYVNQFILGTAFAEQLDGWQRIEIAGGRKLTAHPDLACTQVADGPRELTLIGHILDPLAPDATNADILGALLPRFTSRELLFSTTDHIGGRWLLIAVDGDNAFLFHDALGLRQAFFTDPVEMGGVWVMSQAGLATEMLPLTPDEQALDYMDTQTFRRTSEARFPASASTFKGLKHLLPNHWLDLNSGRSYRYWPAASLRVWSPDAAARHIVALLSGQIRAAVKRFDVVLSVTAGFDSRLALAAAKDVVNHLRIATLRQGKMPDAFPDIDIPARLLQRLGLAHEVIQAASTMTPEFSLRYKRNVYLAHDHYGADAEAILQHFGRTKATITGSGAEVGRRPFRGKLPIADHVRYTPEVMAWLEYGSTHPFLVHHFREWLAGTNPQGHAKLLDLFEWEQDYGNWLAMTQLEFDIAWREIFTPYNCRAVLATMLGVDEKYRRAPDYMLFRRAIELAWPELLSEPINPHRTVGRLALRWSDLKAVVKYWRFQRSLRRQDAHR